MADKEINGITIYGEVLFDCFQQNDKSEKVLGGAPFNICWHLQALGDAPVFISRVGNDDLGTEIKSLASSWGIDISNVQEDKQHPTGQVQITLIDDEPHYEITPNSAYDFIRADAVSLQQFNGILYHGSLALRNPEAKVEFQKLLDSGAWDLFLDVNLRPPWWDKESLFTWLKKARWVKLNVDELRQLGFTQPDLSAAIIAFQQYFGNEQVIVTQGSDGAMVYGEQRFYRITPEPVDAFIDTVGAGDSFTAVYIHGLLKKWPIDTTLQRAQAFASRIIGIRGATPQDKNFYPVFTD